MAMVSTVHRLLTRNHCTVFIRLDLILPCSLGSSLSEECGSFSEKKLVIKLSIRFALYISTNGLQNNLIKQQKTVCLSLKRTE